MDYKEEDYLQLSGIQHFLFCRRQWALIHLEQQWAENYRTTDGALMHQRAHNTQERTRRGDVLTVRGMYLHSRRLGISGQCDVVEFRKSPEGVSLFGEEGLWNPYPVEYKRGRDKPNEMDRAQLCAGNVFGRDALLRHPGGCLVLRGAAAPSGGDVYSGAARRSRRGSAGDASAL